MSTVVRKFARPAALCALLIVAHALLLAWSAAANSATYDEPAHFAAGLEYWRHGDFTIYSLSPPLLRLWAALPAFLAGAGAPSPQNVRSCDLFVRHWIYAKEYLSSHSQDFARLLLLGRLGMIPLSCLAAWVVSRWAAALYGKKAGVAACALWCLNPMVLAHGSLVTTDMGTAAAMMAAAWLWWRFCRAATRSAWIWATLAVVAAHLCKFTAIMLWPMMLVSLIPFAIYQGRAAALRLLAAWAATGLIALLILNVLYGFHGSGRLISGFSFESNTFGNLQRLMPYLPSPLPRELLLGIDAQKYDTELGYGGFLFGRAYEKAQWYYYPAALLVKQPVSMLILFFAAIIFLCRRSTRPSARRSEFWSMAAGGIVYAAGVIFLSNLNLGTRYLLPSLGFVVIFISRFWADTETPPGPAAIIPSRKFKFFRAGLLAMLVLETAWVCPRFISYINFAAGGPSNGWWLVADSDFDWGQSLIDLRLWMAQNQCDRLSLLYFGYVDPSTYGVSWTPVIGQEPLVAVSSFFLNGLSHISMVGPTAGARIGIPNFRLLQSKQPVAVVGNTIFIYRAQDLIGTGILQNDLPPPGN